MERSLFSFVWSHSKRDQLTLLLVTLTLFPLLFLTLELPKRIINDAVGASGDTVTYWGVELGQVTFLGLLCGLFLLSVLVHGAMKMRINTMKGVLAERLLRRLRYTLIARILRFPAPYFERTSQGELVGMVTSEAEPMGGLMGDALAQPILQAGQMLTILGFLFLQSFAFGLAACALIPLQAWLVPRMQRRINQLNKDRVIEVRALAAEIGESAAGAATLRLNRGWRYRLAMISDRLGRLYDIRFQIYQKKFFMKFVNNFIGQLTPFFFYAIGGYLAIKGEITVGALVAALAAYKDLSSPWKELLAYYNQAQDMSLRWQTITERFAPDGMIKAELFEGHPTAVPQLNSDIHLMDVTVRDADGVTVLEELTATFPAAQTIAITAPDDEDRHALAALLSRELVATTGSLRIGDQPLNDLHQSTIASRIGYVSSAPVMFQGTLADNLNMALRIIPPADDGSDHALESLRTGNSIDPTDAPWLSYEAAGVTDAAGLQDWWNNLIRATRLEDQLLSRAMSQKLSASLPAPIAQQIVSLRAKVANTIEQTGLADHINRFDKAFYNPTLPVAENLIFAMPLKPITAQVLLDQPSFMAMLRDLGIEDDLLGIAVDIVTLLRQIFGLDGTDHPLFQRLGLDAAAYEAALKVVDGQTPKDTLTQLQKADLLAVPFVVPTDKVGAAFPDKIIDRVLDMRLAHSAALQNCTKGIFEALEPDNPVHGLSILENLLFGKLREGVDDQALLSILRDQVQKAGLEGALLYQLYDMPVALGGSNLSPILSEPLAIGRAAVKRPDILILDRPLVSFGADVRSTLHIQLRKLLPKTTIIYLAPDFAGVDRLDHQFTLQKGRLSSAASTSVDDQDQTVSADLARKIRALEQATLFADLPRKQLRLLAFGARWFEAAQGDYVFRQGDEPTSGAYLITEGSADLLLSKDGAEQLVTTSTQGDLVGELGLIRGEPRALDMRAATDLTCLRIGAEEFLAVVEYDAATAFRLLQVVAGYVN